MRRNPLKKKIHARLSNNTLRKLYFFFPVPTATETKTKTKTKKFGVTPGLIDTETVRQRGRALAGAAVLRSGLL